MLRDGLMAERRSYFDPLPLLRRCSPGRARRLRLLRGMRTGKEQQWPNQTLARPGARDAPRPRPAARAGVRAFEAGSAPPIVFVHGLLVNANLWRKVVARLSPDFRCIALDLPLGSHTLPMPDGRRPEPARRWPTSSRTRSRRSASRT